MRGRAIYEFNADDAHRFANTMFTQTKQRGNELQFRRCPYCQGTGKGNEYTFSINLNTGLYKCMRASCGVKGNFVQLARDFDFDLGIATEYYMPRKQFRSFRKPEHAIEPKDAAVEYFKGRGIRAEIVKRYGVTMKKGDDNVIAFPFFDESGENIPLVKYRAIKVAKNGSKEWMEKDCKPILFGMQCCDPGKNKRLIVTEGQIDSMSVAEAGIENAVSVPGGKNNFTWVPHCWNFVNQFAEIVVFGDHENGGMSLLPEITQRFGRNLVIKHVREADYKDCKDANDILRKYGAEQVRKCVENAEPAPMLMLKDLADVTAPNNVEKLVTGIHPLDVLLHGGLPFGMYHVIAGKRGNGKSTLASQIFARALDQGYSCMVYSGELEDFHFKFWLDCQLAGPRHIIEDPKTVGQEFHDYIISTSARDRINEWYRGRCKIYDNSIIRGGEETTRLLEVIDEAVRRFGVKVILLDNLMTAMHKEDLSAYRTEYERQGAFCDSLAELAQETGAMIIMVAHKRKDTIGGTDAADDISGSAQITNYAGVVISYDRYSEKEVKEAEYLGKCRKMIVSKNRLYGNVNTKGVCLDFDERSRRIWSNASKGETELEHVYGWEHQETKTNDDLWEIPFD